MVRLSGLQKKILIQMLNAEEDKFKAFSKLGEKALRYAIMISPAKVADGAGELEQVKCYVQVVPNDVDGAVRDYRCAVERVRQSLRSLERRGLVKQVPGPMFLGRRKDVRTVKPYWALTDAGRELARKLRIEMKSIAAVEKQKDDDLKSVIEELKKRSPYATAEEILEALWEKEKNLFEGEREIFNSYWNKKRLGAEMKGRYKLIRKRQNGERVWVYDLYSNEERLKDLKKALVYIRQQNFWRANMKRIREALWKVCNEKMKEEEFNAVWTEKLIGKYMRQLGLKLLRLRHDPIDVARGHKPLEWRYDIRMVPKDESLF